MTLRWFLASLHLLALGIGLGAIYTRARAFRGPLAPPDLARLFLADNLWGLAAGMWLVTGLFRAFGGLEKGSAYYLHNHFFLTKMACFLVIFLLELKPMVTLIRWRRQLRRGEAIDRWPAAGFARISYAQTGLVVLMVFLAVAMARGLGATAGS